MNIITKLKNIRKEAQKQVSVWQSQFPERRKLGLSYSYQWTIDDIADSVVFELSAKLGIHANFIVLDKFLRNNQSRILPRQLSRLAKTARKRNRLVDLLDTNSFKNSEDLRLIRFL